MFYNSLFDYVSIHVIFHAYFIIMYNNMNAIICLIMQGVEKWRINTHRCRNWWWWLVRVGLLPYPRAHSDDSDDTFTTRDGAAIGECHEPCQ